MKQIVALVLCALCGSAWADAWNVFYYKGPGIGARSGCIWDVVARDTKKVQRMTAFTSSSTIRKRREYGHEDPYRPVLVFDGNPLKGLRREASEPFGYQVWTGRFRRGADGRYFPLSTERRVVAQGSEFRIRARLDDEPAMDVWVEPEGRAVLEARWEEIPGFDKLVVEESYISYAWVDWPDRLFDSDEPRFLLLRHPGIARTSDPARPFDHFLRRAIGYSYSNGKTGMSLLRECIDLHVEARNFETSADDDAGLAADLRAFGNIE